MENSATAGTVGKDGTFVPFVMMWAKSVPAEMFYGANSVFSESNATSPIHPDDMDNEGSNEHTGLDPETSVTYTG